MLCEKQEMYISQFAPTAVLVLGLSKSQKSSFLILSRVNPGWIFYVDFRNINFFIIGCHLPCPLFSLNWHLTPLWVKKKSFGLQGLWYSNRPAQSHGFNATIGFEKYGSSPEIFAIIYPNLAFPAKLEKFPTFLPISLDPMHIFQN